MDWDSYSDIAVATSAVKQVINDANRSGNAGKFPDRLMGILTCDDGQRLAFIGSEVYRVGSQVKLPDSPESWKVDSIGNESVVLTFDGRQTVLSISNKFPDSNDSNDVDVKFQAAQQKKESIR